MARLESPERKRADGQTTGPGGSERRGNRYSTNTIVVAISRTRRSNPVIVPIPASQSGLEYDSYVHAGQILTVDKSRLLSRIGQASDGVMQQVNQAIRVSLDV